MLYGKKPNASDKFFPVPNVIFNLGLDGGEILAVHEIQVHENFASV